MNPDPAAPWGVIAAVVLVVLGVSVATCALAVVVGRALRRSRLHHEQAHGTGHVQDNTGRLWNEGPDGLYDLDGSAEPADQSWTYDQLDRVHGPLTGQDTP